MVHNPSPNPETLSDAQYLRLRAIDKGIGHYYPLLNRIVGVESQWNEKAKNRESTAKGYFQILDGTWKGCKGDPLNGRDNIDCALDIFLEKGVEPWCADIASHHKLKECEFYMVDSRSL